jgi:hypothetical protein
MGRGLVWDVVKWQVAGQQSVHADQKIEQFH